MKNNNKLWLYIVVIFLISHTLRVHAACGTDYGDYDCSFNNDGILNEEGSRILQLNDGSFIITRKTSPFSIAKITATGDLDTSFNGSGNVSTPIGDGVSIATAAVEQMDGKIVVAGKSQVGSDYQTTIVRYNGDGSLDASFGDNGIWLHNFNIGGYDGAEDVIVQHDGKLVVATRGGSTDVFRLLPSGDFDSSFDSDGMVEINGIIYTVTQQADTKLVLGGKVDFELLLVRLTSNGGFDSSGIFNTAFDSDGIVTLAVSQLAGSIWDGASPVFSIFQQNDGKLIVAGYAAVYYDYYHWTYQHLIARFNVDGSLDVTFSTDGFMTIVGEGISTSWCAGGVLCSEGIARDLVQLDNSDIVVVGTELSRSKVFWLDSSGNFKNNLNIEGGRGLVVDQNYDLLITGDETLRLIGLRGIDSDSDGLKDDIELALSLNPHQADSDNDGLPDAGEDFDNDSIPNLVEVEKNLDPLNPVDSILPFNDTYRGLNYVNRK